MRARIVYGIALGVALGGSLFGQAVSNSPGAGGAGTSATATAAPGGAARKVKRRANVITNHQERSAEGRLQTNGVKPGKTGHDRPVRQQRPAIDFAAAMQRHHHERHDRTWWKSHYTTIVFATGGYYYWDAGYWFPAFGYNPSSDSYDYDGPIYCYGNLLPDQVIYNVQRALKDLGYYAGGLTGSLGPSSRAALAAFQEDNGLTATGAIDAPTVEALGLG